VSAENLLDRLRIEALEDVANGGVGRRTLPVQAEGGVQSATMHFGESRDGTIGIGAGDDGKDGEQQNMGQLVELAFGSARIGDLAEHGEKLIERPHGNPLELWLPGIDSEIASRRNPATKVGLRKLPDCCATDSPFSPTGIER
jgi:hypothetical protein